MDRRSFMAVAALTAFAGTAAASAGTSSRAAVAGASAVDPRVDELLSRMSAEQKIALIRCDFAALSDLDIPALSMADASAGIRGESGVTAFPVPLAQAATFSPDLVERLATAVAAEGRGKGANNLLAPTVDIQRTWHFGRQAESFGEDPVLAGALGTAAVSALRQSDVLPTLKHFAAYTQELDRYVVDARVAERALREVYYAPFRAALRETPLASVMLAYPKVNGTFATQNPELFAALKNDLGLRGYTVPDFMAGQDQIAAERAGMDLAGLGPSGVRVTAAQLSEGVAAERIHDAARRILAAMFAGGLFDNPPPGPSEVVTTPEHRSLAHDVAVHSTVLLANDSAMLPFDGSMTELAVVGAADDAVFTGVSGSSYVEPGEWTTPVRAIRDRAGESVRVTAKPGTLGDVPLPVVPADVLPGGLTGTFYAGAESAGDPVATAKASTLDFTEPPVEGLPAVWSARWTGTLRPHTTGLHRFSLLASGTATLSLGGDTVVSGTRPMKRFFLGPYDYPMQGTVELTAGEEVEITVEYTNSTATENGAALTLGWQPESLIPEAVSVARETSAALVVVNRVAGEGMDHGSLALPGDQDALVSAVAEANPNTVVVLNTDGPVAMPWLSSVRAVVQSWYGGRGMGTALAAVLFGDADPAGRLPVTFPAAEDQGPGGAVENYPGVDGVVRFEEGVHVGYRYYDRAGQRPLFPFGHGLSYTTFAIGGLSLSYADEVLTAEFTVTNTGGRSGWQTVQLYAELPAAGAEPRRLVGFTKLHLEPAQRVDSSIAVPAAALSVWDSETGGLSLPSGRCTISAGASSRDLPVTRTITLP